MPSSRSAASASGVVALTGSAMASDARELAVDADEDRGRAVRRAARRPASASAATSTPLSARKRRVAERDAAALDRAERRPRPTGESKSATGAVAMLALLGGATMACGQRMLARPLDAGREPQELAPRRSPAAGTIAVTAGLPSVSVPVLSTTSVSTFSIRSSASAFLISTPACAPRPTPTMIDIGVASPSAQGQAMISTDDGGDEAVGEAAARAPRSPRRRRRATATAITAGTNQPETWSASRWIGARLRCASATICTICASIVSRPTFSASHHERAGLVEGAADHLVADGPWSPASTRR